ncbi:MAG: hypothetical protein Tsb006_5490 [Rickettsiaceae bacterium]
MVAFAVMDREIMESKKCSGVFSYFEKRYNLPPNILHAISLQETQKAHSKHNINVVWPWTINVEGKGFHFRNKNEALRFVKAQMREGKSSIDVGCMQINLKYHPDAFVSLEQAFSPRRNVAYAARLLRQHYEKHGSWKKAVGYYHSSTEHRALDYQASVSKINSKMLAYKQSLNHYSRNHGYKNTNSNKLNGQGSRYKPKYLGMDKVSINSGKIKRENMFRRVQ